MVNIIIPIEVALTMGKIFLDPSRHIEPKISNLRKGVGEK
jgi:hypothetical protein